MRPDVAHPVWGGGAAALPAVQRSDVGRDAAGPPAATHTPSRPRAPSPRGPPPTPAAQRPPPAAHPRTGARTAVHPGAGAGVPAVAALLPVGPHGLDVVDGRGAAHAVAALPRAAPRQTAVREGRGAEALGEGRGVRDGGLGGGVALLGLHQSPLVLGPRAAQAAVVRRGAARFGAAIGDVHDDGVGRLRGQRLFAARQRQQSRQLQAEGAAAACGGGGGGVPPPPSSPPLNGTARWGAVSPERHSTDRGGDPPGGDPPGSQCREWALNSRAPWGCDPQSVPWGTVSPQWHSTTGGRDPLPSHNSCDHPPPSLCHRER